jgi:hypothetical protein
VCLETAIESIASYGWVICTLDSRLKRELLTTGMELWRKVARMRVRGDVIGEKMGATGFCTEWRIMFWDDMDS